MRKVLSFLIGFVLFIVAYLLFFPLAIINYIISLIKNDSHKEYFLNSALSLDIYANVEFGLLWNVLMKVKGGYSFGKQGETISSALGKNKRDKTLSWVGVGLCFILDTIDSNHCIKSISE